MSNAKKPRPSCYYCASRRKELRPYGPGGSWVCFSCATETPEREQQTEANFGALLDASESVSESGVTRIGDEAGPQPFDPKDIE